jgi:hypothetical protein
MSSPSGEDVPVEILIQEIQELQIIGRFDFFTVQNGPQRGVVILRSLGFGVVRIVGIDPNEALVGDIVVEVAHSGFYTCARVWVKVFNGTRAWTSTSDSQDNFYFASFLA